MNKILEMFDGPKGKMSSVRLIFFIWALFLMTNIGYLNYLGGKLIDIPDQYLHLTLALAGTYSLKRYLERDGGITPEGEPPKNQ